MMGMTCIALYIGKVVEYLYESLTDNDNIQRKTIKSGILIYVECLTRPRSRNKRFANAGPGLDRVQPCHA